MTLEEALAALEAAKAEAAAAKAAIDGKDSEISALKAKNAEILGEKKAVAQKLKEVTENGGGADAAAIRARVEAEFAPKLADLSAKFDALERERNDLAVTTALDDALAKAGVAVPLRAAARALLKTSRKIEVANGSVLCDGKDVGSSVSDWAATDEGKAFVPASANGGSAAPGGSSGAPSAAKSKMTPSEKGAYIAKHGLAAYNALAG